MVDHGTGQHSNVALRKTPLFGLHEVVLYAVAGPLALGALFGLREVVLYAVAGLPALGALFVARWSCWPPACALCLAALGERKPP